MPSTKTSTCPACTLLCDDIVVSDGQFKNACNKGQSFFQIEAADKPIHHLSGKSADLKTCIGAAVDILQQSQAPLICGLDHLTTQSQQVAWKIAERIGATLDSTMTNRGRASLFGLQRIGNVTATLGEIASRSDVILFWFCDPVSTHPRLLERLGSLKNGKRKLIVIDETETATAAEADQFFQIKRDDAPAVLSVLRAKLKGIELNSEIVAQSTGLAVAQLDSLHSELVSAKYGSVFHEQTNDDSVFDLATDSLLTLIRQLNDVTRFVGMKLRKDGNSHSAENVLAWSSGYPIAINFARNYPRFNWLEYSAETVLTRGECDAILFATGTDFQQAFSGLSRTAQDHLGSIPKIAMSPIQNFPSDVSIQVGVPGLSEAGEFCRNDDVSMPLASARETASLSAESILERILIGIGYSN